MKASKARAGSGSAGYVQAECFKVGKGQAE